MKAMVLDAPNSSFIEKNCIVRFSLLNSLNDLWLFVVNFSLDIKIIFLYSSLIKC